MPNGSLPQRMLTTQTLCLRCNRRTTAYDRRSQLYYQYCGMTCATLAGTLSSGNVKGSKDSLCKHCRVCPRTWDSQRGRYNKYCGMACAHAAASARSGRGRAYLHEVAQELPQAVKQSPIRLFNSRAPYFNLTNESSHPVAYKGRIYPTAQHVFQAVKFLPKHPDLAEHIRRCSSTDEARREVARYRTYIRADWYSVHRGKAVHLAKMEEVLSLKFQQHPDLCEELASSSNAELIYDNPSDAFWGVGPNNKGKNEFGKALMRLRKHVLEQARSARRQRRG